jgi:hypothetical protein
MPSCQPVKARDAFCGIDWFRRGQRLAAVSHALNLDIGKKDAVQSDVQHKPAQPTRNVTDRVKTSHRGSG